ncbi:MAG: alpha/beta hydrolase [Bacteroidota bacterium]
MLRLVLNIIFFLASLLCIFAAPTFRLWIFSIAISEFCWVFVLVSALLLTWSIAKKRFQKINLTLATVSFITFSIPIVLAYKISRSLPTELASKLGGAANKESVFSLTKIFSRTPLLSYETLKYSQAGGEDLTLDYYQSAKNGKRPCVIVIHGGSWRGGNSQQLPELNSELARQGFQVVSVNYRLAPKYKSPAPLEDIAAAIRYLKSHSRELKIDTNNFILLGRSAGAQLALVAAYTLPTENIRGVVNFYGPTDMVFGYTDPASHFVMDSRKVLEDYLGGPYSKVPQNYVSSSPVEVLSHSRHSVPTLIIHGRNDALVSIAHGERLDQRLAAAHIPHFMLALPWATHGCDYTLNGPSGQLTTYAVEYFAKTVVKPLDLDIQISSSAKVEKSSVPEVFGSSGN